MTLFLQPVDQSWMRPIKSAYGRNCKDWLRVDSSEDDNEDANELQNLQYVYFELFNTIF